MASAPDRSSDPWPESRSRPWLAIGCLGMVAVAAAGGWLVYDTVRYADELARVAAPPGRLTPEADDGGDLPQVSREGLEVYYRVELHDAPVGRRLELECDWIDPAGQVAHRNHYKTREIDRGVWPTHARYRIGAAAPAGRWTVRMTLSGRTLCERTFLVADQAAPRDGEPPGADAPHAGGADARRPRAVPEVAQPGELEPLEAP